MTPAQIAALAAEISNDPQALGFAAQVTAKSDTNIAALLNTTGGTAAFNVLDLPVKPAKFLSVCDPTEFDALPAGRQAQLQILFAGGTVDLADPKTIAILQNIFPATLQGSTPAAPLTRAALTALRTRRGTRAEVLFGPGFIVDHLDVARALRG